jgi:hypothetical protein
MKEDHLKNTGNGKLKEVRPPHGLLVIAMLQNHPREHRTAVVGFTQEDFLKNIGTA